MLSKIKSLFQTKKNRLDYIDTLKGVCILFVVFTHMKWSDSDRLLLGFPFWIAMAVPIFMILSGFLYSKRFEKCESNSLASFFIPKAIISSLLRFALPFLLIFPFEIRWAFKHGEATGFRDCILGFIQGGYGPGGYYICMMFQFVLLFPIIWYVIKRWRIRGFTFIFLINVIYEVIQWRLSMNDEVYRLVILRYLSMISFGALLTQNALPFTRVTTLGIFFIGIGYIVSNSYLDVRPFFITHGAGVCLFAGLYAMVLVTFWLKLKPSNRILAIIGTASYEIFLFQKIFYLLWARKILKHLPNFPLQCVIALTICVSIGIITHYLNTKPFSSLIKRLRR